MQDPNLRAGGALLYQLSTGFSASEIFEKRRMLEGKVVPLSKDKERGGSDVQGTAVASMHTASIPDMGAENSGKKDMYARAHT